jgi:hypothetical protein
MDRFVVPASVAVEARWDGSFESLLRLEDDWIREVFIGPGVDVVGAARVQLSGPFPPCAACDREGS